MESKTNKEIVLEEKIKALESEIIRLKENSDMWYKAHEEFKTKYNGLTQLLKGLSSTL